jgi:aspartate-semialdehyde dehydrogenase
MPDRKTVAIIGGETLVGRELKDLIAERRLNARVELVAAGEQVLSAGEDEPVVIGALEPARLAGADVVLLAGDGESSRKALEIAPAAAIVVDATSTLDERSEARIVGGEEAEGTGRLAVVAHPAALVIAHILRTVHRFSPVRHAVVQVFEPSSERGQAGLNELQQQTAALLSFRPLEKKVFDAQLAFAMLPRYGSDAPLLLEDVEQRIERHLATLLRGETPMPSLRLIQAPVFHGHSFSFWIEFENRPAAQALSEALKGPEIDVRGADLEPPTNVGAAGQSGAAVGLIEPDPNHPRGIWLWVASDNFRVVADCALDCIRGAAE